MDKKTVRFLLTAAASAAAWNWQHVASAAFEQDLSPSPPHGSFDGCHLHCSSGSILAAAAAAVEYQLPQLLLLSLHYQHCWCCQVRGNQPSAVQGAAADSLAAVDAAAAAAVNMLADTDQRQSH
jgi:hypothetical protein